MIRKLPTRIAVTLVAFAAVFIGLTVSSYRQESATDDEPQHLVTGYAILALKDFRIDPVHPPFLRMWAALPLLAMPDVHLNTNTVAWTSVRPLQLYWQFMYLDNDADRMLNRARFMNVLLGVLLGVLLFCWSRELFGFGTATIVLGLYCLEPNILAHFSLVTTDGGVTCFIFGAVYFLWRTTQRLNAPNLIGLVAFFALAQVSKYSALALGPITMALLLTRALRNGVWPGAFGRGGELATRRRRVLAAFCIVLLSAFASCIAIWGAYRFQYAPAPRGGGLERIVSGPNVHKRVPITAVVMDWVDQHRLLPNVYAQGLSICQAICQAGSEERPAYSPRQHSTVPRSELAEMEERTMYLLGQLSYNGWWYYFPVAILVKTPISLIVLFLAGLALCAVDRSRLWNDDIFILLPIMVYLGAAMTMKVDIGIRHVLPIYPFAVLIAGKAVAAVLVSRRKLLAVTLAALCLLQAGEVAAVHPHYLAFFNQLVGGPKNGYKYLADSNLDWGQDLKRLKKWMDANGVERINLSYFGSADPAYYGIHCTYLFGSPFFANNQIKEPSLPGLVAVSMQNLTGAGLDGDQLYKPLLETEPFAMVGYSIRVYRVDKPW
jgi:hypothetical protein